MTQSQICKITQTRITIVKSDRESGTIVKCGVGNLRSASQIFPATYFVGKVLSDHIHVHSVT